MGVDEFAGEPFFAVAADLAAVFGGDAGDVVAEAGDHFVLFVEQRDAGVQLGDDEQVLPGFGIGGETVAFERFQIFAVEAEVLQRVVGPVADDDGGSPPLPAVNLRDRSVA